MKTLLPLVISLALLSSSSLYAQLSEQCATCFASQITKSLPVDANCTDYEMKVYYSGHCEHALSHFSVAVASCYTLSNLSNSNNYAQTIGFDPTTGLTGFKIDDPASFGTTSDSYFLVSFRLCANGSGCASCWKPTVAYKAGNCFELDSLAASCAVLKAHLNVTNSSCFGAANGQLAAIVDNGVPPYHYNWSNGSVDPSISNLNAGNYTVIISDAAGSQLTLSAMIKQASAIIMTGTVSQATCSGQSNGSITVNVSGGTGSYTYLWNNGTTASTLPAIKAGIYTLAVHDSLGCSADTAFSVTNQKQLVLSASTILPGCTKSNGSLSLSVTGGTGPYTFVWSNDSTGSSITNLSAGLYSVTATDAEGCEASTTYFLRENNTLRISYIVKPTTCLDDGSGAIDVTVTGGTQPYSYSWSNGATTEDIGNLTSASYFLTVTDSAGCQMSARFTVFKNTFEVVSTVTQPLCASDSTGSISVSPGGGVSPYQFTWSTGATTPTITGLSAGSYSVTITDSTGCSKLLTYFIINPPPLQATSLTTSTSCNVYAIDLSVTGGTSPYTYLWSTGDQTQDITGVASGNYAVTITDANGCPLTKTIGIDNPGTLTCSISPPLQSPTCLSSNNKIFATLTDADSYQWQITSADGSWQVQSGSNADTLVYFAGTQHTSATFSLTISKNGCTQSCSYQVAACASSSGTGGSNDENCGDCFTSTIVKTSDGETCASYEVTISTDGNCRYDLSHMVIAIPCGVLSDYSDSGNWPLVVGKDPTTGLTGLKVDNVNNFGKAIGSFTLKFTVCFDSNCGEQLKNWNPVVAYKAGQCIAYDTLKMLSGSMSTPYPNPFKDSFSIDVSSENDETIQVELYDPYGRKVCEPLMYSISAGDKKSIQINTPALPQNIYLYKVRTSTKVMNGRIVKSN